MNTSTRAGRRRTAGGVGFGRLYSTTIPIAGTVILLRVVIPRMTTRLTGVEGSSTAASCTPYESRRDSDSVMCSGTFTARDGSFSLTRVSADTTFDPPADHPRRDRRHRARHHRGRLRRAPGPGPAGRHRAALPRHRRLERHLPRAHGPRLPPAGGGGSGGRLRAFPPGM
ncbi:MULTISPECIES: hypothetical protein [unclassified Streptomyces]|uniref:hypothetical protein n=1 Tax=unclassified Streptomyces TaxID=2593676 RepID=UPI00364CD1D0